MLTLNTRNTENMHFPQYSAYGPEYYHLIKKSLKNLFFEKINFKWFLFVKFLINFYIYGKKTQEYRQQNTGNMSDLGKICHFVLIMDYHIFFFKFQITFYKIYEKIKKIICWRITLYATSLTIPSPSIMGKIHQNLKIVKFSI